MQIEELNKMVEHEIQWISYYSTSESRSLLNENSDLYLDLVTMGYCKTPTPLYLRCSVCLLSNGSIINENTDIKSIEKVFRIKGEFDYTPLELFMSMFPDRKIGIINQLKPIQSTWKAYKSPVRNK
jgi:hypothetical protein